MQTNWYIKLKALASILFYFISITINRHYSTLKYHFTFFLSHKIIYFFLISNAFISKDYHLSTDFKYIYFKDLFQMIIAQTHISNVLIKHTYVFFVAISLKIYGCYGAFCSIMFGF